MKFFKIYFIVISLILLIISCSSLGDLQKKYKNDLQSILTNYDYDVITNSDGVIITNISAIYYDFAINANLEILNYTSNQCEFKWTISSNGAAGKIYFKIAYSTNSNFINSLTKAAGAGPNETAMDWTSNITNYTKTGLSGNTRYYFVLVSKNEGTNVKYHGMITVRTSKNPGVGNTHPYSGPYSPLDEEEWGKANYPLGAHKTSASAGPCTFAVYAKNAEKVLLEIYEQKSGVDAKYDYWMVKGSDNIWRAKIDGVSNYTHYAFRVWGPNWTNSVNWKRGDSSAGFVIDVDTYGNRYNPNKVLFDPYGRELSHDKSNPQVLGSLNGWIYASGSSNTTVAGTNAVVRYIDTGRYAPKSIVVYDTTSYGTKPNIPEKDTIIYEAHVRGLTKHESAGRLTTILQNFASFAGVENVPEAERGTYKGAAKMAKYLKALGFTTIELLPVHETDNDANPDNQSGGNYWGYMTYGYFAPDRRYAYDKSPGGPTREFKEMVKAFHDEGIEVYLDVVYNHSGEGGRWFGDDPYLAEITFLRGFDNSEYYALVENDKASYWETTGCGNNLNASKTVVKEFIKDSLKYWITEMGVDGFRFDLAPVLGRDNPPNYYFNPNAELLIDIANMTTTYNVKMIAEAWDCQWPGGYQVSNFPEKWAEWNGIFRDVVRKFAKGDGYKVNDYPDLGAVINGSYELSGRNSGNNHTGFNDNGGPHKSVNFIVAHDGFTLTDLVSYNTKINTQDQGQSWPFGPSDGGANDNDSWDSGGNQQLRRQRLRNFWTILIISRGVPMAVWGDEFGRTQNGNNNPYNVDSVATWNNYDMINRDAPNTAPLGMGYSGSYHNNLGTDSTSDNKNNLFVFVTNVLNYRKNTATLRQDNYSTVTYTFKRPYLSEYSSGNDRCVSIYIDDTSSDDKDLLVFMNMYTSLSNFNLPSAGSGKKWVRIIDTHSWAENQFNFWHPDNATEITSSYGVNPWSIVVLQKK